MLQTLIMLITLIVVLKGAIEANAVAALFRHGSGGSGNKVTLPMRRAEMTDGLDRGEEDGCEGRGAADRRPEASGYTLSTITSADRCTGRDRKERRDNDRRGSRWEKKQRGGKKERKLQGSARQSVKWSRNIFLLGVTVKIAASGK